MAKKLLFLLVIPFALFAGELKLIEGSVKAHTEIFGDSSIDPSSTNVKSNLHMKNTLESINGDISIDPLSLISDNEARDSNMYDLLERKNYKTINFKLQNIQKDKDGYLLKGVLNFHGVSKDIKIKGDLLSDNNMIQLKSKFTIKMSDYNIEPPSMLFLTVRDEVDIDVDLKLKAI